MVLTRLIQRKNKSGKNERKSKQDEISQCEAILGDIALIDRAKELLKLKALRPH